MANKLFFTGLALIAGLTTASGALASANTLHLDPAPIANSQGETLLVADDGYRIRDGQLWHWVNGTWLSRGDADNARWDDDRDDDDRDDDRDDDDDRWGDDDDRDDRRDDDDDDRDDDNDDDDDGDDD